MSPRTNPLSAFNFSTSLPPSTHPHQTLNFPVSRAGVVEEYVGSADELQELVRVGDAHRAIGATGMNEASSRSHSILTIQLLARDTLTGSARTSRLCLVDLAGSEAVSRTGAEGSTLNEAKMINKSLFTLSLCSCIVGGVPLLYSASPLRALFSLTPRTPYTMKHRYFNSGCCGSAIEQSEGARRRRRVRLRRRCARSEFPVDFHRCRLHVDADAARAGQCCCAPYSVSRFETDSAFAGPCSPLLSPHPPIFSLCVHPPFFSYCVLTPPTHALMASHTLRTRRTRLAGMRALYLLCAALHRP